jgi:tetratricopeptide (TPR) repeat protein
MVDLSKHLARAKQAIERRNWALALETCEQCLDVDPANLDVYKLHLDAAKRKAKESDKKSMLGSMSMPVMSKDPHKQLTGAMKRVATNPDVKTIAAAGDAAQKVYKSGVKPMLDVAIFLYEEMKASGLFNAEVLWNLSNLYFDKFNAVKDQAFLDKAIKTMGELERAVPNHAEAGRTIKNWEARRSMEKRNVAGTTGDYRSQLSSGDKSHRQEVMGRIIRTVEDAMEVLKYVDEDLKTNATDKALWVKKGETHRRINQLPEARAAFVKAQELDQYDFGITMKLGDISIEDAKARVAAAAGQGEAEVEAKKALLATEIAEYRKRAERQPTEMTHKYNLGVRLLQGGNIDAAAAEFQRTVGDPRYRRNSHRYLGYCFSKKNLLDLAVQEYKRFLSLVDDHLSDEAKEVRYLLGRQLEDLGKRDDAMAEYSRLVEIDLGYKDVADRLGKLRGA